MKLALTIAALISLVSATDVAVKEDTSVESAAQLNGYDCPSKVKVNVYTDSNCHYSASYYTRNKIQKDWNILTTTMKVDCYNNGNYEYLSWYCSSGGF